MPINNDLTRLPRSSNELGAPPTSKPFVAEALAAAWEHWYEEQGLKSRDLAIPEAGPYRGSMASSRCDRQLYYALAGVEVTNPSDMSDYWTFWLGQLVHEALEPIVLEMYPGASEVKIDLRSIGIPGSAHSDLQVEAMIDGHRTLIEIKSTNGFSFKTQAAKFNGPPQGPRYGSVMQALLAADAQGIDRVVILLVSLERIGPNLVEWATDTEAGRFLAEWHYTVSEMREQIDAEKARILRMVDLVEHDELPTRELNDPEYPAGAVVQEPKPSRAPWTLTLNGAVRDSGTYWGCGYCRFRDRCQSDGPGGGE